MPKTERIRLVEAIDRLRDEPHAGGVLKGEFSGLRRLRVGNYRIIYEIVSRQLTVLVVRIGHRGNVYRRGQSPQLDTLLKVQPEPWTLDSTPATGLPPRVLVLACCFSLVEELVVGQAPQRDLM